MTIDEYLDLITSAWRQKPKFTAMVSADVSVQVRVQDLLASLIEAYDVDTAVGSQLDVIGQWVGISRRVNVPIANVYFSWNADYTLGWEYGTWQPANQPFSVTVLPDDSYRTLIRAKIAANLWDGTTDRAYAIWDAVFPTITILIQDHQNMSYDLAFVGGIIDSLTLALITGGYIPLKPEGVKVNVYYIPINPGPMFCWDLDETTLVAGWETGSWAREVVPS